MLNKTCCFTGHRPQKTDINDTKEKELLRKAVKNAIDAGYEIFISGMAMGTDLRAAEVVIEFKKQLPHIKLVCASPFKGVETRWSADWQARYTSVLEYSDKTVFVSPKYSAYSFHKRNIWMVDRSGRVIASFNGTPGGTKNTIEYAKRCGRELVFLEEQKKAEE